MKVVILDDLNTKPLTTQQQAALNRWCGKLEKMFPHGEMQIFQLPEAEVDHLHEILARTP